MTGMYYRPHDHCYVCRATGEVVPAERIDEWALEQLDQSLWRFADAWAAAMRRWPQTVSAKTPPQSEQPK